MEKYIGHIEIMRPKGFTDDDFDGLMERLLNSKRTIDPILTIKDDVLGFSYAVDCDNAKKAIDAGLQDLLGCLGVKSAHIIEIEAKPFADPELDKPVNQAEVAERLGVSRAWVTKLAKRGQLPKPVHQTRSGRKLYRWGDIKEWQERRSQQAAA